MRTHYWQSYEVVAADAVPWGINSDRDTVAMMLIGMGRVDGRNRALT